MTKIIDIPVNGDCDVAYINANGTTIVGSTSSYSYDGGVSTSTSQVWRWTSAGGLNSTIGLPTYSKHDLSSVSSDGTVIAGYSLTANGMMEEAKRLHINPMPFVGSLQLPLEMQVRQPL